MSSASVSNDYKFKFTKSVVFNPITVDGTRRIIAGYANVSGIIDSQGDVITNDALVNAWEKFRSNPDFAMLQLFHSNVPIAKVVFEPVVDSNGVTHSSGVDENGLYVVAEVRSDITIADETWQKIMDRKIRGFSIGGQYLTPPVPMLENGLPAKRVEDIELHEISIVDNPSNQLSTFSVLKDDSILKLSELTDKVPDNVFKANLVQISKTKSPNGKYMVYIDKDVLGQEVYNSLSSLLKSKMGDEVCFVTEIQSHIQYVPLFDLALLRPYTIKEEVITSSIPVDSKDGTLSDKSNVVEESIMSEVKQDEVVVTEEVKEVRQDEVATTKSEEEKPKDESIEDEEEEEDKEDKVEKKATDIETLIDAITNMSLRLDALEQNLSVTKIAKSTNTNDSTKIPEVKVEEVKQPEAPKPEVKVEEVKVAEKQVEQVVATSQQVEVKQPEPIKQETKVVVEEPKPTVRGIAPQVTAEKDVSTLLFDLYKTPWSKLHELRRE